MSTTQTAIVYDSYTTTGSVRGTCGHRHRTVDAAVLCILRDRKDCERAGGYSDRRVVRGDGSPLDDHDQLVAHNCEVYGC